MNAAEAHRRMKEAQAKRGLGDLPLMIANAADRGENHILVDSLLRPEQKQHLESLGYEMTRWTRREPFADGWRISWERLPIPLSDELEWHRQQQIGQRAIADLYLELRAPTPDGYS